MNAKKTFIIAEAGVNHNGNIDTAIKLIDVAVDAGADAVKFQTFVATSGVTETASKAEYQKKTTKKEESQLEMVRKLELNKDAHLRLKTYCDKKGILFLSTPFDLESVDLLIGLGLEIFKIPSGEIINLPYLRKIGRLGKKIILSTGMATMAEIGKALSILIKQGTEKNDIVVLQCNTEYPTPPEDVNLLAMATIGKRFGVKVGLSDHTTGIEVPIAAVALGAVIIEKHFTLNKKMAGPDHCASLEPSELKAMVNAIRTVEKALGDKNKKVTPSEAKNLKVARKSIVAAREINKGEEFTAANMAVKRPGTGISPLQWDKIIGKKAKRDFKADEFIKL